MLGHVLRRARRIPGVDSVIVATTDSPVDVSIVNFANKNGAPVYVGSENDVLDRFYQAAKKFGASTILRVTPDCPVLDPHVSGLVLDHFLGGGRGLDVACNTQPPTYPDGLDTEVFSFDALATAWRDARWSSEREHVTSYLYKKTSEYRVGNVTNNENLSYLRWTVDDSLDLAFVRALYSYLDDRFAPMHEILSILKQHPELMEINSATVRNEGYLKSLKEDVQVNQVSNYPSLGPE